MYSIYISIQVYTENATNTRYQSKNEVYMYRNI